MVPEVSIIIPARNEAANIGRCLDAVFSQETARPFEVIVIDSGSDDGTVDVANSYGARVISIPAGDFDHGRTRNLGHKNAGGRYLVTLVADATPADGRWLEELIAPLESDPTVAGAYSRQLSPPGAHPLEAHRLNERFTAGERPIINEWPGDDAWEALEPERRLYLANFDDVSAVRRSSAWERIPIAENYWGEDLDWSLEALKAGWRIAFAPKSAVLHAHRPALVHAFRRAYVDQAVVKRMFGVVYFANSSELRAGWRELAARDDRILRSSELGTSQRLFWRLINPIRRLLEVMGAYLAAISLDMVGGAFLPRIAPDKPFDFAQDKNVGPTRVSFVFRDIFGSLRLARRRGEVLRTSFTIGGSRRNVVFAHPPSSIRFKMRLPPEAHAAFYPAINPDAWDKAGPVTFELAVDGLRVYEEELHPASRPDQRAWNSRTVDLSHWFGRRVEIEMITRSNKMEHAWAGWGEPRILASRESWTNGIKRRALEMIAKAIYRRPLRHP